MGRVRNVAFDALILVLGNALMAFAVTFFILPNNILSGGVAGIAVALNPILDMNPEIIMNVIIIATFILGCIFLGKQFAIKTVASSILYPIFISLMGKFIVPPDVDPILASVYGGLVSGVGLGLTFRTGASTGGMDIPPLILEKYTNIRVSVWILIIDAITVLLGLSSYGLNQVLIGFISVFTATFAIDKIQLIGGEQAKQVLIISDKNESILEAIHTTIDRGTTLIHATGGYTGERREIIMTVLMKEQYAELEKFVKGIDENAFLIVSNVTEVHGNGFYKV